MKRITLISQSIILLALVPVGIAISQPRKVEEPQATITQSEVVATPVAQSEPIVEPTPVVQPVPKQTPQLVVQPPVVSEPAPTSRYDELLRSFGYESRFHSGARSATIYMFTYKLAEQYPERFTADNVDESIARIHTVFSNTPDPEWTNVYLNFPW